VTALVVTALLGGAGAYRLFTQSMDARDSPSPTDDILAVEAALKMYHEDTGHFPVALDELLDAAQAGMRGGYLNGRGGRESMRKVTYERTNSDTAHLVVPGSQRLLVWNGHSFVATWGMLSSP
jgi:hypothetical protein